MVGWLVVPKGQVAQLELLLSQISELGDAVRGSAGLLLVASVNKLEVFHENFEAVALVRGRSVCLYRKTSG